MKLLKQKQNSKFKVEVLQKTYLYRIFKPDLEWFIIYLLL